MKLQLLGTLLAFGLTVKVKASEPDQGWKAQLRTQIDRFKPQAGDTLGTLEAKLQGLVNSADTIITPGTTFKDALSIQAPKLARELCVIEGNLSRKIAEQRTAAIIAASNEPGIIAWGGERMAQRASATRRLDFGGGEAVPSLLALPQSTAASSAAAASRAAASYLK